MPDATFSKKGSRKLESKGIIGILATIVEDLQQEIQDGFPDALDMMLVCVEAGQSLDQALMRVGRRGCIIIPCGALVSPPCRPTAGVSPRACR